MLQGRLNHVMVCHAQKERLKLLASEEIVDKVETVSTEEFGCF